MRNLTTTICLTIAVLLGSAGVSWSADFHKPIILGTSSYKLMKTTIDITGNLKNKKLNMSFIFQHSLKHLSNNVNFSMLFVGCKQDANLELLDLSANVFLTVCNLVKNTNIVTTSNIMKKVYDYKISHPSHGTAEFNVEYKSDNLKLESKIDLHNIPNIDQYQGLMAKLSLKDMSSVFEVKKKNGERLSGKAFIENDKLNIIVNGIKTISDKNISDDAGLILRKLPTYYEWYLKNINKSVYYFGGMSVKQGEVLKTDIVSEYNKIKPIILKGFKVNGEDIYRGRKVISVDPIIDLYNLNNNELFIQNEWSFIDGGGLMYVDSNTGIPTQLDYSFGILERNQRVGEFKIVMNTNFYKTEPSLGNSTNGIESRLTTLKSLHSKGLISDSEYKAKKEKILEGL